MIERHGGTTLGSTRAELQHWAVNLDDETATITGTRHRQIAPLSPREGVKAESDELAGLMLGGQQDGRLHREEDGSLRVLARAVYPDGSGYKRTVEGRRVRLCRYIGDLLGDHGWTRVAWNRFRPPAPGG